MNNTISAEFFYQSHVEEGEWALIYETTDEDKGDKFYAECLKAKTVKTIERYGAPIGFGLCTYSDSFSPAHGDFILFLIPKRKNGIADEPQP